MLILMWSFTYLPQYFISIEVVLKQLMIGFLHFFYLFISNNKDTLARTHSHKIEHNS